MAASLNEIYQKIFNEAFDYDVFNSRKKLQKTIYILENMGVCVGDYSFTWDKYGPYSLALDFEAKAAYNSLVKSECKFSEFSENCFAQLIKILQHNNSSYDCVEWLECISSSHYLKNISHIEDEKLFDTLKKLKPHLVDDIANQEALKIANSIKVDEQICVE